MDYLLYQLPMQNMGTENLDEIRLEHKSLYFQHQYEFLFLFMLTIVYVSNLY